MQTSDFISKLARDYILGTKICIAVILTLVSTLAYQSGIFDRFENLTLDLRFRLRPLQEVNSRIVLIEIADDSVEFIGKWPWERKWHAALMRALNFFGAQGIAFDVLFPESEDPESDRLFGKAIQKAENIYLPVAFNDVEGETGFDIVRSLPVLRHGTKGEGHIAVTPDSDGIIRRIKLRMRYNGQDYLQLGFVLALETLHIDPDSVEFYPNKVVIPSGSGKHFEVPLTDEGDFVLNWPGPWNKSFKHASFIDTVAAYQRLKTGGTPGLQPGIFQHSLCIVGASTLGLFDIRATPLESEYPAMGVNATVLNSFLNRQFLKPLSHAANIVILWVMSFLISVIMLRSNYLNTMIMVVLLALLYITWAFAAFIYVGWIATVVYPLFLVVTSYVILTAYHQIIISFEKTQLTQLAITDVLTGLYNVGHFKKLIQLEVIKTQMHSKKHLCILMIDGDHFKQVNDTYGHAAGDEVLKGLATALKENCRGLDVAARYGGEEFIVMLPGADRDAGKRIAEKMRNAVEEKNFLRKFDKNARVFTASFGVASYRVGETVDEFLKRADDALYQAKDAGRNRVTEAL